MRISTKGRYAFTVMLYLAKNYKNDTFLSLNEIAKKENISIKYLEKVMLNFKNTDYLISARGLDGGYKLKYEPKQYRISDILKIAEGDISVVSCINEGICDKKNNCLTIPLWTELNTIINNFLDSKTLEDYI